MSQFRNRHGLLLSVFLSVLLGLSGCDNKQAVAPRVPEPARTPPATQAAGLFEDVTERAGISFRHTNGAVQRYLFLQTIGGGCAFLDYDNDGFLDVLLLSCGDFPPSNSAARNLTLYHNNGDGAFTDITVGSGLDVPLGYAQGVAVGDYDNDGYPDIFVSGYGGCHLFHNEDCVARVLAALTTIDFVGSACGPSTPAPTGPPPNAACRTRGDYSKRPNATRR